MPSPRPHFAFQSTEIDTNRLLSDQPLKSPMGAVLRSAILPGWGQAYNQQYLKAVASLGINAFLGYHIFWYHQRWRDTGNREFQGKRNLYTWYFALAYLLNMVDAYVDAYLFEFEKTMEIGHQLQVERGKWIAEIRVLFKF